MANKSHQLLSEQCASSENGQIFSKFAKPKKTGGLPPSQQQQRKPLANIAEAGSLRQYLRPIKQQNLTSDQIVPRDRADSKNSSKNSQRIQKNENSKKSDFDDNGVKILQKTLGNFDQQTSNIAPFEIYCDDDFSKNAKKDEIGANENSSKISKDNLNDSFVLSEKAFSVLTEVQRGPATFFYKQTSTERKILLTNSTQLSKSRLPLAPLDGVDHSRGLSYQDLKISSRNLLALAEDENSTCSKDLSILGSTPQSSYDSPSRFFVDHFSSRNLPFFKERERHLNLIFSPPDFQHVIYKYARKQEIKPSLCPKRQHMKKQPHLTPDMRTILVDWMVDVAIEYHLENETLHLSVNYVDRFLSLMVVSKEKLQLVGTTAMLIASKYEEIYPPDLQQFVSVTADAYTIKQFGMDFSQVLKMERYLLNTLRFELTVPTVNFFLDHFLRVCGPSQRCLHLTKYLSELALLDVDFLKFSSSQVAAAIVCVANLTTESVPWPVALERASEYSVADIYDCMTLVLDSFKMAHKLISKTVFEKYSENKYCQVALLTPPTNLPPLT